MTVTRNWRRLDRITKTIERLLTRGYIELCETGNVGVVPVETAVIVEVVEAKPEKVIEAEKPKAIKPKKKKGK